MNKTTKKVFELHINGKFFQYLLPSEVKLLKWEHDQEYTLKPINMSKEHYKIHFGN